MNRPWVIWCVSGLIALLVFGAMGVITRHTLGLEKETVQAEAKAELEGRIRIALWRMDTYAAGILAEENNRPAWHFRDVDMQRANRLTPLNVDVPENVILHFQIDNGNLTTPQVNGWSEVKSAWSSDLLPVQQGVKLSAMNKDNFQSLKNLIYDDATFMGWQAKRNVQTDLGDNNLGVICAVASRLGTAGEMIDLPSPEVREQMETAQQQRIANPQAKVRGMRDYQVNYNAAEKAKRKEIVQKWVGISDVAQNLADSADDSMLQRALKADQDAVEGAHQSPLRPVWIGGELVLVRQVQDAQGKRVQGVWLDAASIRNELTNSISDLLPEARLEPVKQGVKILLGETPDPSANEPMVLAALPWRLLQGEVAVVSPGGWTPMRKTLAVAWVGAVLAALAAMVLLRGVVKLSERRASFVSSVTHELRTPLTTFSLYSDLLAEGMVQDEEKKQAYLDTLRKESARLTHLVENVLAYSRIERGSARARVEQVEVGALIDRMCERLRKRAEEVGMELRCEVPGELARLTVEVDTTAVEQIIFNLVDNASKYASGEGCGKIITLRALERGRQVVFQVSDLGKGILVGERNRLFRAFHKSAQEAAHTKPGVGLGLALSRRLARALGGDLRIVDSDEGACFELQLSH